MKLYKAETTNVVASAADGGSGATAITTTGTDRLTVTVSADVSAKFTVTGSATPTAGASQNITVTAYDQWGNVAAGYTGDHTITFSGATTIGANNPTVSNKNGASAVNFGTGETLTFTNGISSAASGSNAMRLYKVETANVVASAADGGRGATAITTTGADRLTVAVGADVSAKFAVTGSATQTAGGSQTITVTAYDTYGNVATGYTGDHTITFSGAATIGANNPTVTNKNGAS